MISRTIAPSEVDLARGDRMSDRSSLRTFERGLEVLRALNASDGCTALGLAKTLKLTRPVVSRALQTLVKLGYVTADSSDGRYRVTSNVAALSSGLTPQRWLVEIAVSYVRACGQEVQWPVGLSCYSDSGM